MKDQGVQMTKEKGHVSGVGNSWTGRVDIQGGVSGGMGGVGMGVVRGVGNFLTLATRTKLLLFSGLRGLSRAWLGRRGGEGLRLHDLLLD